MKQDIINKALYEKRKALSKLKTYKFIALCSTFCTFAYASIDNKTFMPLVAYFGVLAAIKLKRLYKSKVGG